MVFLLWRSESIKPFCQQISRNKAICYYWWACRGGRRGDARTPPRAGPGADRPARPLPFAARQTSPGLGNEFERLVGVYTTVRFELAAAVPATHAGGYAGDATVDDVQRAVQAQCAV